jgi:hypothetical protein
MSNIRTTIAVIESAIDKPDYSFHLRNIADLYEEGGNDSLSRGYRWLADRGKVPSVSVEGEVIVYVWNYDRYEGGSRHGLPSTAAAFSAEARNRGHNLLGQADTVLSDSFRWAANLIALWLDDRDANRPAAEE